MFLDTNVYADFPFLLAVLALGFGLSLVTYRGFARRYGWPMGEWHTNKPALPILIGTIALLIGALYALARGWGGYGFSGWMIAGLGILLAIVWTGILRVGSQVSLFLAPAAAALLFVSWFGGPDALDYRTVRSEIRELRDQLRAQNVIPRPRQNNN
jgi:hypothetical protein